MRYKWRSGGTQGPFKVDVLLHFTTLHLEMDVWNGMELSQSMGLPLQCARLSTVSPNSKSGRHCYNHTHTHTALFGTFALRFWH